MADLFLDLPQWRPQVAERARTLKSELVSLANKDEGVRAAIDARVEEFNSDWRELDRLIRDQFWRVAFFRVAEDEINYRRFFNINDLAGLRIEAGPVFDHVHARIFRMLESGEIDGLRIDHIDGLFDPKAYLEALRAGAKRPFYLVVEKILAPHESLRADWPVEGTTGYDYTNLALGVLVDPGGEAAFTQAYYDLAGEDQDFATVARDGKLRIMENEMASELNTLGRRAAQLAGESPMTADLTRALLQRAIRQVVANFPVYRTYLDFAGMPADADRRDIAWAMTRARRSDPDVHPSAFDFLQNTLMAETEQAAHSGAQPHGGATLRDESAAVLGSCDGQRGRGHRFLSLQSVRSAQRSRRRPGAVWPRACPAFTRRTPRAPKTGRTPCWRPRPTTRSAAKTIARGSLFSPKCRRNGAGRSRPGPASCERDAATWSAPPRPTATTNTCFTRCSWAPGRSICSTPPAPTQLRSLWRAHSRRSGEIPARGETPLELGRARR